MIQRTVRLIGKTSDGRLTATINIDYQPSPELHHYRTSPSRSKHISCTTLFSVKVCIATKLRLQDRSNAQKVVPVVVKSKTSDIDTIKLY